MEKNYLILLLFFQGLINKGFKTDIEGADGQNVPLFHILLSGISVTAAVIKLNYTVTNWEDV